MPRDLADELLQAQVKARLFGGDHAPRLGRLVILDRIGSGAMGAVYAAYDPRLDRRVAVKVLHAADAEANARSLREARALGKLAHPNVIAIHDAREEDGAVHIVMELAAGTPLRAWIHKERTWRDVVRVMRDAARGLAAAHRAGVVHRDVKPDNVIVGDDATRVVDFGLALPAGLADDDGAGTPVYMAPECLAGEPATAASDQFSFGVTLFEALYGERPHAGTTRDELRRAALLASAARPGQIMRSEDARSLGEAPTDVDANRTVPSRDTATPLPVAKGRATQPPGWVHAIVRRALAAEPGKRFATMDDVVAALGHDQRRARTLAAVGVGALAVGAIGGVLAYRAGAEPADLCDPSAQLAATWTPARGQQVRAALGDAPWVTSAVASLDDVARAWSATSRGVCEATRVRGGQSDRLLELRMRCLDRALDRFDALATALVAQGLDAGPRSEAASAIAQLPRPETCATLVDAGELALPAAGPARTRALAAEHDLDRVWSAYALGRYRDARAGVDTLERAIGDLDAPAVHAQLAVLAAAVEARTGEPAAARARLERALALTAKARAHELEHAVWMRLLRHELFAGNPARTIEWEPLARAAALRAGFAGAELDGIIGEAHRAVGALAAARTHLERALGSRDPLRRDQRAIIEMNLGSVELAAGRGDAARAIFDQALAHAAAQLGDGHPSLAIYRDKLAEAERARGDLAAALAHHDASLALRTAAYGERDRAVATARFHRAETLLAAGELDRATADLDAARAIRAQLLGETSPRLGEIDLVRGDVELARGNRAQAVALYTRAVELDPRLDVASRIERARR